MQDNLFSSLLASSIDIYTHTYNTDLLILLFAIIFQADFKGLEPSSYYGIVMVVMSNVSYPQPYWLDRNHLRGAINHVKSYPIN